MSRFSWRGRIFLPEQDTFETSLSNAKHGARAIVAGERSAPRRRHHPGLNDDLPLPEGPVRPRHGVLRPALLALARAMGLGEPIQGRFRPPAALAGAEDELDMSGQRAVRRARQGDARAAGHRRRIAAPLGCLSGSETLIGRHEEMFRWFESRLNPFPPGEPVEPPGTLIALLPALYQGRLALHRRRGDLQHAIALAEVGMFGLLGNIVDWLSTQNRETFLETEGWKLAGMAAVVLVGLPGTVFISSLLHQQTLMGNYPMRIRWQVHRYLLKQSMTFYQDEFAGRIATKLMQTALAVRECVMKLIDVLNYVVVYFLGALVIVGSADWRLAMPLVAWLAGYVALLRFFVPRLGKVSEEQADARSTMTGRIVDSYTNIQTVKLFSHAGREAAYAQGEHVDLPRHRLPLDAAGDDALCLPLRPQLVAAGGGGRAVDLAVARRGGHHRRGRGRARPRPQVLGHVAMDHVGGLGAVREHRHGSGRHQLDLAAAAGAGQARCGRARREPRRDRLRRASASTTARRRASSRICLCVSARARRSALSAAPAPANRRWSTCSCASTTSRAAAS